MPASKITLGIPAYGYLSGSYANNLVQRRMVNPADEAFFDANAIQANDGPIKRRGMEKRYVTVSSGWSTTEGQIMWHDVVSQGALVEQSDSTWTGAGGFTRHWDACSSTVSFVYIRDNMRC